MKNFVLFLNLLLIISSSIFAKDLPRFAVISDTHIGNKASKAPKALKNIFSHGDLDAIFVVGDLTDNGIDAQFAEVNATFTNPDHVPPGVAVYYMMGNHDNYGNYDSSNKLDNSRPSTNSYLNRLGQPLHQYIEIKGYPFITVSMTDKGSFDAAAKQFLTEKLACAAANHPGKPIFVFYHIPPGNTCYGSRDEDGWGTTVLPPFLNGYPQVIVFSGHSHYPLGDPRSIHQGNYTAVNDGSTIYSEIEKNAVDEGIHPDKNGSVAEGIIVNVLPKSGNIEMERWDTYRNEEILPRWTVKAPFDGSNFATEYANRNGLPAPVFASGDELTVKKENGNYTFTFPAASETADDVVHHYVLEILDNQQQIIKTLKRFSGYYLNSEKPGKYTFSVDLTEMPFDQTFTAQVKAIDAYGNQSLPLVSAPFVNENYSQFRNRVDSFRFRIRDGCLSKNIFAHTLSQT
ncbi:MAG: metallophosphoesterase [Tannerella sp.]|jgi:predicted phosphodiesterase|nr:metallophosphoesterase [Tannerella sp.]